MKAEDFLDDVGLGEAFAAFIRFVYAGVANPSEGPDGLFLAEDLSG